MTGGALVLHGGLSSFFQQFGADLAGGRQRGQRLGGLSLRPHNATDFQRVGLELGCVGPCGVSGGDQSLVVGVSLRAALLVCQRQSNTSRSRYGERVNQSYDVAAQCARRSPSAAKHILQLAALLQKYRQRLLPTLQAGDDVGELRWHSAQCGSGLCCADAHLVQ